MEKISFLGGGRIEGGVFMVNPSNGSAEEAVKAIILGGISQWILVLEATGSINPDFLRIEQETLQH